MTVLVLTIIFALAIAALLFLAKIKGGKAPQEEWPFYAKKPLSAPEQVLYLRLVEALPEYIVLAQVGLSRLLGVKRGNNFQAS